MTAPKSKKEVMRSATFAEGGARKKMFGPQSAAAAVPARTGKIQGPAPGAKAAKGGPPVSRGLSLASPAAPGRTAPMKKGR